MKLEREEEDELSEPLESIPFTIETEADSDALDREEAEPESEAEATCSHAEMEGGFPERLCSFLCRPHMCRRHPFDSEDEQAFLEPMKQVFDRLAPKEI
jgi:hypothetical protein